MKAGRLKVKVLMPVSPPLTPLLFSSRIRSDRRYDDRLQAWVRDLVRGLFRVGRFSFPFNIIYKGKLSPFFPALFGGLARVSGYIYIVLVFYFIL